MREEKHPSEGMGMEDVTGVFAIRKDQLFLVRGSQTEDDESPFYVQEKARIPMPDDKAVEVLKNSNEMAREILKKELEFEVDERGTIIFPGKKWDIPDCPDAIALWQATLSREKRLQEIVELANILISFEGVYSIAALNRIKIILRLAKGDSK